MKVVMICYFYGTRLLITVIPKLAKCLNIKQTCNDLRSDLIALQRNERKSKATVPESAVDVAEIHRLDQSLECML